ncbi:YihY/virulence factor BrkB family protein [Acidaminobacter sp. JC074]|uniref:YihY/virulence factor BrkB family protein n=1 Tax=Acidaminobacter sp. JC074 TaxID=2530199 RepID=UPI001F0EE346|nr:YihY/virulence factor BrkB family protein [Acidaminobacter sp. JC074]MCH4890579.1 YihY/virulence factor BrkB family protein [Acidaminobacter sp. JC074]
MSKKNFIIDVLDRFKNHHIESFASQIAFYIMLSIFPFLILLLMFLTNVSVSYSEEMSMIYRMIPEAASSVIQDYLLYSQQFSDTVFSPILVASIWMSSNAVIALMKAVNVAYDIEETRNYFVRKLIAIICTLMIIVLIIVALIISNLGTEFLDFLRRYIEIPEVNLSLVNFLKYVLSIGVFSFILGALYFIVPNKKVTFREVIPGTIFSFFGLTLISRLFAYFVSEFSQYSLVYGSLAAVIILMIWLFLCGLILMIGGEINAIKNQGLK